MRIAAVAMGCLLVALAMGKDLIGQEKRSKRSEELLASFGGIPKGGIMKARSITKDTRSAPENVDGASSNCGQFSGSEFEEVDWTSNEEVWAKSGAPQVTSHDWSVYCFHALVLVQIFFVLVSMA